MGAFQGRYEGATLPHSSGTESVSIEAETVQFPMLRHATEIGWTPL